MSDKYFEAVERFANKYSTVKGVISIEPDDFGADIVVVLVDDQRYKNIELPAAADGYEVHKVEVYALREVYKSIVDNYIVNDSSMWDINAKVPFQLSLDNLEILISDYENKIEQSINNSFLKIKSTLDYVNTYLPELPPADPEKDSYSPFVRPEGGLQSVSESDLAYLQGTSKVAGQ